jgi:protein-S-isoprenylcysteine O-methyltransferase Ste14
MSGTYLDAGGVEHARTMLAYHRDAAKTASALIVVFGIVFGFEGWMLLTTGHGAYIFGVVFGLAALLLGIWLHIHHGRNTAHWAGILEDWERVRRDRLVHARRLKGWEL